MPQKEEEDKKQLVREVLAEMLLKYSLSWLM